MTDAELEALAETIISKTQAGARVNLRDPQTMAAIAAVACVLFGAVSAWATTTTRLDSTALMVEEVRDDLRSMRVTIATESDLLRLEERVLVLERE